ncbi:MAG TPA: aminotransferase class V-fold PLP-dependent enzyme, partial [Telluria sp.]|nr:aminotransferase class V-fold PLP-dependent enzyme [Telluria sp.]
SGATEGIQTAVLSALCAVREGRVRGRLALYGATEHKAVPEALAHWNRILGTDLELRAIPVDEHGRHRLDLLRELAPQAAFVCTMAANNETGVVSDLAGIEQVLNECAPQALWMVDCVQALGKLPLALERTRIDYAPFSGHKLYAPKGIGMLYVRPGAPFTALMMGGGQEAGSRSGTENMAGIAALGAVLAALEAGGTFRSMDELSAMRERVATALRSAFPGVVFNMPFELSLPTTVNFSVPGVTSRELLELFDAAGVRVSSGSACSAAKATPSHVLEAMGLPCWRSASAVRLSFGPCTEPALIEAACARIERCGAILSARAAEPAPLAAITHFVADGACSWILADPDARVCAIVDPAPALAERLAALVRASGCSVRAVLSTTANAEGRVTLARTLGIGHDTDTYGWPHGHDIVALADRRPAPALTVGRLSLARLASPGCAEVAFLAGVDAAGVLAGAGLHYVFVAGAASAVRAPQLTSLLGPDTLLCCAEDEGAVPCAATAAPTTSGVPAQLDAADLARFLEAHPDALLVDVREPHERMAGPAPAWRGRAAAHVPLSQLVAHLPGWLRAEQRPLVFFCRSGNRSARAALCLHRLGYRQAYQLCGGLALNTVLLEEAAAA